MSLETPEIDILSLLCYNYSNVVTALLEDILYVFITNIAKFLLQHIAWVSSGNTHVMYYSYLHRNK